MATDNGEITGQDLQAAKQLLQSPSFFMEVLRAVRRLGLVGEQQNALAVYIVALSRLLLRPLNLLVKGSSSSGKNFLVDTVLRLFPLNCVHVLSSAAARSWNYLGDKLKHGIVYIKEVNASTGTVLPTRLLISEQRLIHYVTERRHGRYETVEYVTEGPVACISTTTKSRLEVDDETRNVSIRIDESCEQSRRILAAKSRTDEDSLGAEERQAWHAVQEIIRGRADWPITRPRWFETVVAPQVPVDDVSIRRHYSTFLNACEVVCLLRSFRRPNQEQLNQLKTLSINFIDYATAWFIFNSILAQSLDRADDSDLETLREVEKLLAENGGMPVQARDLARAMNISDDKAYDRMRGAEERGLVRRANPPERTNRKLYLPSAVTRFAPDPASVFKQLELNEVKFVHPLTGKLVVYRRRESEKPNAQQYAKKEDA
jgi:hypothetical protein